MSKNAFRKRLAKASHRNAFSRVPRGVPLGWFIRGLEPQSTPLMDMLKDATADMWGRVA